MHSMAYLLNLSIGVFAAALGVIPPGLLNMSAAKIGIQQGQQKALWFATGVCITVAIQTSVALLFARYLEMHPEIIDLLQKVALGIFICLSIYFLFLAKDTRRSLPQKTPLTHKNRLLYGIFLAFLNVLPIPYWVYIAISLSRLGWFKLSHEGIIACTLGAAIGTFLMLWIYARLFMRYEDKPILNVNMNIVIGIITSIITVFTFLKVWAQL